MAKLYADEDFSLPVVDGLPPRSRCRHGPASRPGEQGRQRSGRAGLRRRGGTGILTFNRRHFIRLHRTHPVHDGIIVCTRDGDTAALAGRIHQAVLAAPQPAGRLLRVNRSP